MYFFMALSVAVTIMVVAFMGSKLWSRLQARRHVRAVNAEHNAVRRDVCETALRFLDTGFYTAEHNVAFSTGPEVKTVGDVMRASGDVLGVGILAAVQCGAIPDFPLHSMYAGYSTITAEDFEGALVGIFSIEFLADMEYAFEGYTSAYPNVAVNEHMINRFRNARKDMPSQLLAQEIWQLALTRGVF